MDLAWLAVIGGLMLLAGLAMLGVDIVLRLRRRVRAQRDGKTTRLLSGQVDASTLLGSGGTPGQAASAPGTLASRVRRARRRRLIIGAAAWALAFSCLGVAAIATSAFNRAPSAGPFSAGIAQFSGDTSVTLAGNLAGAIAHSAAGSDLAGLTVLTSKAQPLSEAQARQERQRMGAGLLWWGEAGSQWLTASITLAPDFAVGQAEWQRYTQVDTAAAILPLDAQFLVPARTGVDPLVPLTLALVHLAQGQYAQAAEAAYGAQATLDDVKGQGDYGLYIRGVSLLAAGKPEDARTAFDDLERAGNMLPEGYADRALARLALADYAGATADANRVLADRAASNRAQARAYLVRARARYRSGGELTPALADLNESSRLDPSFSPYRQDKGEVLYRLAQPEAARVELESLTATEPDAAPAQRLLGLVYLMLGQPDRSLDALDRSERTLSRWISDLRTDEAQAQARGEAEHAQAATEGVLALNRELASVYMYEGMALSDKARSEPAESFLGTVWRAIRGEPSTYERAVNRLQDAARLDPNRTDVQLQLANVYELMGDTGQAAQALEQAQKMAPGSPEPYFALARLQESQHSVHEAVKTLSTLLGRSPGYYQAYQEIYRIYSAAGDAKAANQTLRDALQYAARTSDDHLWRGRFLQMLGDNEAAVSEYQAALANPELWEAHLHLGEIFDSMGRHPDALAEYKAVLDSQPNHPEALLGAGKLLMLSGDTGEAEKLLKRLTGLVPSDVQGHIAYLQLLLARGDTTGALAQGQAAVQAGAANADAHLYLGEVYEARRDWPSAASEFATVYKLDPQQFEALVRLTRALFYQDKYQDTIQAADTAIALRASDPQPYKWKAEGQLALGDARAALSSLDEALKLAPTYADALAVAARARLAVGDTGTAADLAVQASSAEPGSPAGPLALGEVLLAEGRGQEAGKAFDDALARVPNYAPALVGKARALQRNGDIDGALKLFGAAGDSDPSFADSFLYKGDLLSELGRWDDAWTAYSRAVQLRPNWPLALVRLGRASLARRNLDDALSLFQRAAASRPSYADAWAGQGAALRNLGRQDEAVQALAKATSLDANQAEAWLNLGLVYEEQGKRAEAAGAFTRARDTATDAATKQQAESGLSRVK